MKALLLLCLLLSGNAFLVPPARLVAMSPTTTAARFSTPAESTPELAPPSTSSSSKGTSLTMSSFNLVKACVGAGVLSLPSAVAALSSSPTAVLPSVALLGSLGLVSGYSFYLIGKLCSITKCDSLSSLWAATVSPKSESLVTLCTFLTPLGAALSYSIILADTTSLLAKTVGFHALTRTRALLALTGGILYVHAQTRVPARPPPS